MLKDPPKWKVFGLPLALVLHGEAPHLVHLPAVLAALHLVLEGRHPGGELLPRGRQEHPLGPSQPALPASRDRFVILIPGKVLLPGLHCLEYFSKFVISSGPMPLISSNA